MYRRLVLIGLVGSSLCLLAACLNPVSSTATKLLFLGLIGSTWATALIFFFDHRILRRLLTISPLIVLIPLALPGRPIDATELRRDYVHRLSSYEGASYFWGGESRRGIDCSGLPRRALLDALLVYGFKHVNGKAFRSLMEQWWYDASAKALAEGYRGSTTSLGISGSIRSIDDSRLMQGDLAITTDKVHMLAYMGDGNWIQAHPGKRLVCTLNGKTDRDSWFALPVTIHRWRLLEVD